MEIYRRYYRTPYYRATVLRIPYFVFRTPYAVLRTSTSVRSSARGRVLFVSCIFFFFVRTKFLSRAVSRGAHRVHVIHEATPPSGRPSSSSPASSEKSIPISSPRFPA